MKKVILFLILGLGCSRDKIPGRISIQMMETYDPEVFKQQVILYKSDEYRTTTPFNSYISSYPFTDDRYKEIKEKAIRDIAANHTLFMQDYLKMKNHATTILALHLENGSCLIRDKKNQNTIQKIEMENYHTDVPMTSTGGHRFYISGKLFLEMIDFMS